MVESIKELREICQNVGEFPWPERKVSIYITRAFLATPITANQVTIIDLALGVCGNLLLFLEGNLYPLVGAVLLELFAIFDCVDGEIARYRKSSSAYSEFFQDLAHPLIHPMTFVGLAYGVYTTFGQPTVFLLCFSSIVCSFFNDHVNTKREQLLSESYGVRAYRNMLSALEGFYETRWGRWMFFPKVVAFVFTEIGSIAVLSVCASLDLVVEVLITSGLILTPLSLLSAIGFKYLYLIFYGVTRPILLLANVLISFRIIRHRFDRIRT